MGSFIFLAEFLKCQLLTLTIVSRRNPENKTFTIKISDDKKYELLKHM
ncbi:16341_t:CDS:1, partial [Racocetra fulgida]